MKFWVESASAGGLVDEAAAHVSIFDHGFTVGDGVFETLKTNFGKPFALDRHLIRLMHSAQLLELVVPSIAEIKVAISAVLNQDEVIETEFGRLRVTVTAGRSELGSLRSSDWTLAVAWSQARDWPQSCVLSISDVVRNERSALASAKTTSYAENALALHQARKLNADEAVVLNLAGNVSEATGSNVFIVSNGTVKTPPLSDGCLGGITRELVLEWMPSEIPSEVCSITPAELLSADEVFVTSSTRDIQAVRQIDNVEFKCPAPITSRLQTVFAMNVSKEMS